jgi:hypothetical protein
LRNPAFSAGRIWMRSFKIKLLRQFSGSQNFR